MYSHAPVGYRCPFCRLFSGEDLGPAGSSRDDIVYQDGRVAAIIASKWWRNNKGHVLIIPMTHYENIYDLPPELGTDLQRVSRKVALAMKQAYQCDGVSTRQHNEPAGLQSVWHYHVHLYPRYRRDFLNLTWGRGTKVDQRRPYAEKLRKALAELRTEEAAPEIPIPMK